MEGAKSGDVDSVGEDCALVGTSRARVQRRRRCLPQPRARQSPRRTPRTKVSGRCSFARRGQGGKTRGRSTLPLERTPSRPSTPTPPAELKKASYDLKVSMVREGRLSDPRGRVFHLDTAALEARNGGGRLRKGGTPSRGPRPPVPSKGPAVSRAAGPWVAPETTHRWKIRCAHDEL